MKPRCSLAALVVACLLGALASPAAAAPPMSAKRFADATLRLAVEIKAKRPAIERSFDEAGLEKCGKTLLTETGIFNERAVLLFSSAFFKTFLKHTREPLQRVVADLDAIPTNDPALRSGRAAWRTSVEVLETVASAADEPCRLLARWAKAGFRRSAQPKGVDWAGLDRIVERGASFEEKLDAAVARLRRLGIAKGEAERFTGDSIFEDIVDEEFEGATFIGAS